MVRIDLDIRRGSHVFGWFVLDSRWLRCIRLELVMCMLVIVTRLLVIESVLFLVVDEEMRRRWRMMC